MLIIDKCVRCLLLSELCAKNFKNLHVELAYYAHCFHDFRGLFKADISTEKLSVVILLEIHLVQRCQPVPAFSVASTDTLSADEWCIMLPQMTEFFSC